MIKTPAGAPPVFSSNAFAGGVPFALGTKGYDHWDRRYRFVKAGIAALVAGNALQAAVENTAHQAMTAVAAAIGDKTLTFGVGASPVVANQYADGIAVIDMTIGAGYSYPIAGHPANAGSLPLTVTLANGWPIQVALTTASKVNLYPSKYRDVIQSPVTTASGGCAGVAVFPIAAAEYGWIGDQGDFATLITGTPAIGAMVTNVGAVAGAVAIWSGTLPPVGTMLELGVDTKIQGVRWNLT